MPYVDPRVLLEAHRRDRRPVTLVGPYCFPRRFRWWRPSHWREFWRDVRFVLHWRLWR